jgi:ribose-phosphate pyrophosphokinase
MTARAAPERPHRLTRRTTTDLMLFAGRSNPTLAAAIAARLGIAPGDVQLETFGNGEMYCRYGESIRGADVFIVQSGSQPVNDNVAELLVLINAAKLASARRITAVMPLFPYARQDKKSAAREPISARLLADLLQGAGADRILTMDLHAGQIVGFFGVPVDHVTALPLFARHYRRRRLRGEGVVVVVSPDLGRVKAARRFARMLDAGFAIVTKVRPQHERAVAAEVIGDVRGKHAVIGDDMIVSGGTLAAAAEALAAAGALDVRAFATHALFSEGARETLAAAPLEEIAVTDTVAPAALPERTSVVSVADLLADTIRAVFLGTSVSALFAGENELF